MQTLPLFSVPVIIDHLDINSSKLREEKCYVTNESGEDRPFDHYRILEKYPKIKNALLDRFKNIAKNVLYHNKNNFYTIKDSLNKNSDKIHILKTAFDLTTSTSELSDSIDSLMKIVNIILNQTHRS